jgi:NAD(P)-dependent dehydrogenase (short-subunit alcohol dehydrogenase family)
MGSALVTGASRGIGLATSVALARAGYEVIATMRNPGRAPSLEAIAEAEGLPITIQAMDVDSDESVRDTIGELIAARGTPDALVNNAGIERHGSVEETRLSDFRAVMETNYFGVIRCSQAVLPTMRERGSGCIVNVSSVAGRVTTSPLTPYSATKHALESLTDGLAQEVKAFGIRVALVEPGIIATDMARAIAETESSVYPQGRRMAALFAASLSTGPDVVAEKIRDVVMGDTWQLRHPVGPGAGGLLKLRQGMSDEDWIDRSALDDDAWFDLIEQERGVDLRGV